MRDLLDKLTQIGLNESVGLARRKPGDRWINSNGQELIFNSLTFYPESGAFADLEKMQNELTATAEQLGVPVNSITWINQPRGAKAYGIAHFVDNNGKNIYIGKYFKSISPNRNENEFSNTLPGGFKLQTGAAKKEQSEYKPSRALSQLNNLTPDDIRNQLIAKFGPDSDEANAINIFMSSTKFPITIPKGNIDFSAFTNYFCEILQPMALVLGIKAGGNATEAESNFLTQGGFSDCVISFGGSETEGLTDSTLTNSAGQLVGLSSKAAEGAWASASNLTNKISEINTTPAGKKLLSQHKEAVSILEIIASKGYRSALSLGVLFNIITIEEEEKINALKRLGPKDLKPGMLTPKLEKLYRERKAKDPDAVVPFFHLLAAVAFKVEDYVNNQINFSEAASDILNFGAFMQAYTTAKLEGDNIVINNFNYIYPSKAVTGVMLRAGKTYYSTNNKGNFTFEILKNNATPSTPEEISGTADTVKTQGEINIAADELTSRTSDVTAASKGRPGLEVGSQAAYGRKKQKN